MSMLAVALGLALPLVAPVLAPTDPPPTDPAPTVEGSDEVELIEVETKPDWLFPGLDHPRVQAFFRSGSMTGPSLFNGVSGSVVVRPLVRAGTIKVHGGETRAERRAARRFARTLVKEVRPALEACYMDSLGRTPSDATRVTFRVDLSHQDRGPVLVSEGQLGDVYGNACAHGVLEFAEAKAPRLEASLEIPVWFWLQTTYGPTPDD